MTVALNVLRISFAALMFMSVAACTASVPADKLIASELAVPAWDTPAN
ncbi:MAG TPA: hypothetical protein VM689_13275 [Aliidongia sp.]|nr:hypothetical protein [Aliidongia sp.]